MISLLPRADFRQNRRACIRKQGKKRRFFKHWAFFDWGKRCGRRGIMAFSAIAAYLCERLRRGLRNALGSRAGNGFINNT
jgi:hypothetical protein